MVQVLRLNVKLCCKRDVSYHPAGIANIKLIEQWERQGANEVNVMS